ncbi:MULTISPECIES: hypothetical protein [Lysobacter]|uniref:hypothetical protein n=1 Tax=Lysobacter TaxID=68 RepID=UPI001F25E90A|nr:MULTISPECIES: hypothetical protein [Lysobacter]UJB21607.1 hypothetical protein L1A79_11380 [Lysobacter capsici]UJQ29276.1 hypothetical protein L2D09_03485 [Lysobacter gummosus]
MTTWKMTLKSLDVRLRRSKAEPAFAGMTTWKMALKSPDTRLRGNDDLEDDADWKTTPKSLDTRLRRSKTNSRV